MKILVYLLTILASALLVFGLWNSYKEYNNVMSLHKDSTVAVDPFEVKGDYSSLPNYDSINHEIKVHSYEMYEDSDMLEKGLPDSILKKRVGIPPKDTLWMLNEDTPYHKMPKSK